MSGATNLGPGDIPEDDADVLARRAAQLDGLAAFLTLDDADPFHRASSHIRQQLLCLVADLAVASLGEAAQVDGSAPLRLDEPAIDATAHERVAPRAGGLHGWPSR